MILVDLGSKGRGTWLIPAQFIKKKELSWQTSESQEIAEEYENEDCIKE